MSVRLEILNRMSACQCEHPMAYVDAYCGADTGNRGEYCKDCERDCFTSHMFDGPEH